ncbi:MAG: hypothetical protein FJY67_01740 [Calditrichaeota bacterium]|nr:hypothetical protein [Calditrichota bacterium]
MEQMGKYMFLIPVMYFSLAFGLGYIFIKGYENRGLMEGLRFGLIIWVMMSIPRFCAEVIYYRIPKVFDITNLVAGLVIFPILGILFALIYKPAEKPAG